MPLALDIFLWLGPRLSVDGLLRPFVRYIFLQARRGVEVSELDRFLETQTSLLDILQDFNLLSLISKFRMFPIGISSLLSQTMPVETPLGEQSVVQISSVPLLIGIIFILTIIGWLVGGLYFRGIRNALGQEETGISSCAPFYRHSFFLYAGLLGSESFITNHVHSYPAGIHQSIIGQCRDICDITALILVDRPVIFCAARDLCTQTECILFCSYQFEIGAFHLPNQRNVRDQCADPITGIELFMESTSQ